MRASRAVAGGAQSPVVHQETDARPIADHNVAGISSIAMTLVIMQTIATMPV